MNKDIEVELDGLETPLNMVLNNIKDIVNDMDDRGFCFMDELKEGVRLTVVKIEILKVNEDVISMNGKNSLHYYAFHEYSKTHIYFVFLKLNGQRSSIFYLQRLGHVGREHHLLIQKNYILY